MRERHRETVRLRRTRNPADFVVRDRLRAGGVGRGQLAVEVVVGVSERIDDGRAVDGDPGFGFEIADVVVISGALVGRCGRSSGSVGWRRRTRSIPYCCSDRFRTRRVRRRRGPRSSYCSRGPSA